MEVNLLLWLPGEREKKTSVGFVTRTTGHVRVTVVYHR
jgi:hypothetical protein